MNPWPVYEAMKKHWRSTRNRLSEKELRLIVPEATQDEIKEGIIEFELAYERSFKHEEYDFDGIDLKQFFKPSKYQNVRSGRGRE